MPRPDGTTMSLLDCPNEMLIEILRHVTDPYSLAALARSCKILNEFATPALYNTCPTLENCDHFLPMNILRDCCDKLIYGLADTNARFVRHLVLDPYMWIYGRKARKEGEDQLKKCVNLESLTAYVIQTQDIQRSLFIGTLCDKVTSLTLRIVRDAPDAMLKGFGTSEPTINESAFKCLRNLTRVQHLRILVEPTLLLHEPHILHQDSGQLISWIVRYTQHLKLKSLRTNILPTYENTSLSNDLQYLETRALDLWIQDIQFHASRREPQAQGRAISRLVLSRLMEVEKVRTRIDISGTHVILNTFNELRDRFITIEDDPHFDYASTLDRIRREAEMIHRNELKQFKERITSLLVHCTVSELHCTKTDHSLIDCGHSDIYLDFHCFPGGYIPRQTSMGSCPS